MAYTTAAAVKQSLTFEYWVTSSTKIEEDGYAFTLNPNVFTDETDFLEVFIDRCAAFIDTYVGGGPFVASGVLETVNRWLAVYEVEQYLLAATSDRVISVSINEDKNRALRLLDKMVDGDITVTPDGTSDSADAYTPALIEPDNDGDPLAFDTIGEDVLLESGILPTEDD